MDGRVHGSGNPHFDEAAVFFHFQDAQITVGQNRRVMLNGIIHPVVKEEIRRKIAKEERKNTNLFIVEAALLIEDNYEEICDELWYVYVEDEIRKKRLIYARGYDARKVDDIIAAQLPKDVFLKHCDRVIDNNGVFEETKMQLDQIVADL